MTMPEVTCDVCHKKGKLTYLGHGRFKKPDGWLDRPMHGKPQIACSPECAGKLEKEGG